MRWRYIEDFIGNGFEYFDGLTGYKATDDESKYTDDKTTGDVTFALCNGYFQALKIDVIKPLLAVPQQVGASSTTYFCDSTYFDGDATYCRGRGGVYEEYGLFCVLSQGVSSRSPNVGSRLLLIP